MKSKTNVFPRITLEPTRLDAMMGVCNSPTKCMYVLTARRIFPKATHIAVQPNCVTVTQDGKYHHYGMVLKGVLGMANFDHDGASMSDADLKRAKITLEHIDSRPCSYKGTDVEKARHRIKSAKYRARPGYVRPDGKNTIRAQVARTYNKTAPKKIYKLIPKETTNEDL